MNNVFNNSKVTAQGWYWVIPSADIKHKQVKAAQVIDQELVVFRTESGEVKILNAYCPHMGAHLAEGKVEGKGLRCFFHHWKFAGNGECIQIPCLDSENKSFAKTKSWPAHEAYGLIWVWLGNEKEIADFPVIPELENEKVYSKVGKKFTKNCHSNVVMVNAIDEHHFYSVHNMSDTSLKIITTSIDSQHLAFENKGKVPQSNLIYKIISGFYRNEWTYRLNYWFGNIGSVTFGPDFLHFYLMFALRPTISGGSEGHGIYLTKHRSGIFGWLFNQVIVFMTMLADLYFGSGDTKVFQTIKFDLKHPIVLDKTIMTFIKHLNAQPFVELKTPFIQLTNTTSPK